MTRSSGSTSSVGAHASVTWETGRSRVIVIGECDLMFEPSGATIITLLRGQRLPVDVDLSGVTLFCAAGVGWLASLYRGVDSEVRVVAASSPVKRVLDVCGVPLHSAGRPGPAMPWSVRLN